MKRIFARGRIVAILALAGAALLVGPASQATSTTVATYSGLWGFSGPAGSYPYGMGYDATDSTVLYADYWNKRVRRVSADGSQDFGIVSKTAPLGANGGICVPYDVEADPDGNVWVADQNCSRVVEFDHNGNWIRTIGRGGSPAYGFGCGNGNLNVPTYLLIDPATRNVYVSDPKCGTVYIFSPTGTYVGTFDWTQANLGGSPKARGIAEDANGDIYVAEARTQQIVVFDKQGHYLRKFGPQADMNDPRGIAIDRTNGLVYAVGAYYNRVFEFTTAGSFVRKWSGSGTTPFNSIRFPATDNNGHVWIGDTWGYRVWKFDSGGNPLPWSRAPEPPPNGGYNLNMGVAPLPGNKMAVIDTYEQRGQAFDLTKVCATKNNCPAWLFQFGGRAEDQTHTSGFSYPRSITYGDGYIWVGDHTEVVQWTLDGTVVTRWGTMGNAPGQFLGGIMGIRVISGKIYTTDVLNCRVQVFDETGHLLNYMGSCGTAAGQMKDPRGLAVNGNLAYVAEVGNNRISEWNMDTKTVVRTFAPICDGIKISGASGVTLDPTNTWLYIADTLHGRVVRVAPDGTGCQVVTAGTDTPQGKLGQPRYLDFATDGRLLVSTSNRRVYGFNITG